MIQFPAYSHKLQPWAALSTPQIYRLWLIRRVQKGTQSAPLIEWIASERPSNPFVCRREYCTLVARALAQNVIALGCVFAIELFYSRSILSHILCSHVKWTPRRQTIIIKGVAKSLFVPPWWLFAPHWWPLGGRIMAAPLSINMMTFVCTRIVWGSPGLFGISTNIRKALRKLQKWEKMHMAI
jgi:hypothetical protein